MEHVRLGVNPESENKLRKDVDGKSSIVFTWGVDRETTKTKTDMSRNRATKMQAVELIREAVASGWKRSVSTLCSLDGSPWYIQVSLTNHEHRIGGQLLFGFKTKRGNKQASVQTRSRWSWQRKTTPGLWSAAHVLREVNRSLAVRAAA